MLFIIYRSKVLIMLFMLLLLMMIMMKGTMMLLMLPMMMMMAMMMVKMERLLRDLVTMMEFRTFLHKESCNVFSSIKFVEFNNIRQNFKLVTLFKLCMLLESSSTLRHSSDESPVKSVFIMQIS